MLRILTKNIVRFLLLILLQAFVLNNIQITALHISPFFYLIFILLLPFETPGWILLLISFALGGILDIFSDTFGIHAASCVFIAFIRPFFLDLNSPRDGYAPGSLPALSFYGFSWFFRYTLILVLMHHIVFFFLEAFSFQNLMLTFGKIALSTLFSSFVIIISQYFIFKD